MLEGVEWYGTLKRGSSCLCTGRRHTTNASSLKAPCHFSGWGSILYCTPFVSWIRAVLRDHATGGTPIPRRQSYTPGTWTPKNPKPISDPATKRYCFTLQNSREKPQHTCATRTSRDSELGRCSFQVFFMNASTGGLAFPLLSCCLRRQGMELRDESQTPRATTQRKAKTRALPQPNQERETQKITLTHKEQQLALTTLDNDQPRGCSTKTFKRERTWCPALRARSMSLVCWSTSTNRWLPSDRQPFM